MSDESFDKASRAILRELQQDARVPQQSLAERVDREKLGLHACVLANVSLERHVEGVVEGFERQVRACPEIVECHGITGEADYLIKVVVPDMKAYDRFLHEVVFRIPGVASIRTNVVLREVKYETALPL
jgi:DNA-binding Lrp family transcriptional regulator